MVQKPNTNFAKEAKMTEFHKSILSDVRWPAVSKIINETPAPGRGPMRVRSFRRRATLALQQAGYSEDEIAEGWKRHWTRMSELLAAS